LRDWHKGRCRYLLTDLRLRSRNGGIGKGTHEEANGQHTLMKKESVDRRFCGVRFLPLGPPAVAVERVCPPNRKYVSRQRRWQVAEFPSHVLYRRHHCTSLRAQPLNHLRLLALHMPFKLL